MVMIKVERLKNGYHKVDIEHRTFKEFDEFKKMKQIILINCEHCNKEVEIQEQGEVCPYCGYIINIVMAKDGNDKNRMVK